MKRDLNLIREMMLALETNEQLTGRAKKHFYASQLFDRPDVDDDKLTYHLMQIIDEGWLTASYNTTAGDFDVVRLTADGHDFIDASRNPDVWQKAQAAMKAGGAETLRFAWDIAKSIAKKQIESRLHSSS